jgi:hypothetical protein
MTDEQEAADLIRNTCRKTVTLNNPLQGWRSFIDKYPASSVATA